MARLLEGFGNLKEDSFDFEQIARYFLKKDHSNAFQILSDKTCNDLDFNELFCFIDRTNSKIGQQFLYNKMRIISSASSDDDGSEQLIEDFTINPELRVKVQYQLSKLNNPEAFYIPALFQDDHLKPPKWFFVIKFLSLTSLLSLVILFFNPMFLLVSLGLFLINLGLHYWNKRNLYQYLESVPQLLKLNGVAKELFKYKSLKAVNPDLQESISIIKLNSSHKCNFWISQMY